MNLRVVGAGRIFRVRAGSLRFLLGALLLVSFSLGCRSQPAPEDLPSLRRSGHVSFFCLGPDRTGAPLIDCPLGPRLGDGAPTVGKSGYQLHALVTQTLSAEVAIVRVAGSVTDSNPAGRVVDVDPANPGVTPLRVGANPTDVTTTPGGLASFVTVAEPGRAGIFGLATSCTFPPLAEETRRDLTTWPACRLSSAPGAVEVLVDEEPGRSFCGNGPDPGLVRADLDGECSVDLSQEEWKPGRRKLLVALPHEGKMVVLDAQELLDREQGSFAPCLIEAELELDGEIPDALSQPLPPDLMSEEGQSAVEYSELGGSYLPRPARMAADGARMLVSDGGGPLVHVLDTQDPCHLVELEPYVATSFTNPERRVTTAAIAVSPRSLDGTKFAYVVDERGDELSSVVLFDLSHDEGSHLPVLRGGSALISAEAPDRLEFAAAVKDVGFARLDEPLTDPVTGTAVTAVACDPDPRTSEDALSALYRPSSDESGASPYVFRGIFGYVLLSDGNLMVVDVEDYDGACRRPSALHTGDELDFRGCSSDPSSIARYTVGQSVGATPTVSDEASCRAVVPHRVRSARRIKTVEGSSIGAPALRSFVRLSKDDRGLSFSRATPDGKHRPILLGADFDAGGVSQPAAVHVGTTLYQRDDPVEPLVIDPNVAERAAPVLPFVEPRAYPNSEVVVAAYEGALQAPVQTGKLDVSQDELGRARLVDDRGHYCARGVQDKRLTAQQGQAQFALGEGASERFSDRYTDYVQVTNLLYHERDPYWSNQGASCGDEQDVSGYAVCDSAFGVGDEDELSPGRDFAVVAAYDDYLELVPRAEMGEAAAQERLELLTCCFPDLLSYVIRAGRQWVVRGESSGFAHPIVEGPNQRCELDVSPLAAHKKGRAFEVASTFCPTIDSDDPQCGVGLWNDADIVCAYDATRGPVETGGIASECIFDSLNRRFVIYRGLSASQRDMAFAFEVSGGFVGMSIAVSSGRSAALPHSMTMLPEFGGAGVVDAQNQGLMLVDLQDSRVASSFF